MKPTDRPSWFAPPQGADSLEKAIRRAEQHLEEVQRRYSQDSFFHRDLSTVLLAEENLRKIRDLPIQIRQAEINLEETLKYYDKDSIFVVMAENKLRNLRGY